MKYDAIIIGAGLGGLTCGAKLAKEGKKVLLVEQHAVPGGCATTFKRKDYIMEVGLHEMDGLDNKDDPKRRIFEDLAVFTNIQFVRAPEFYRCINNKTGMDIVVPFGLKEAADVLVKRFPHEEKGIRKFFSLLAKYPKELNRLPRGKWKLYALLPILPFMCPNIIFREKQTIGDYLDSLIKDEQLKMVLVTNLGYYGDNPYTLSLLFFAIAQGSYYSGGGHYIKGGSQKLSTYLADVIKNNGGEVIFKNLVTEIITENDKATGVRYKKTSGDDKEIKEAYGNYIIANAPVPNVVNELLPASETQSKLSSEIEGMDIAYSAISIYIGFKKPPKELGNNYYSTFVSDESMLNLSEFAANMKADFTKRGYVFVDYDQIDSGLTAENKGVGVITISGYMSEWDGLDVKEYKSKKEEVAQIFIEKLDKLIPGIKEEIEYYEVATPKTIRRYTLNPNGSFLGFANTPAQSGRKRMPQETLIQNLYFASAWTMYGGGFTGAILGGYACAEKILKKSAS
jgi:phytoene dehydrogenase-like protein